MSTNLIVVELPMGREGLNGSKNFSEIPLEGLIAAENLTFEDGTIQKEGGTTRYNSDAVTNDGASAVSILAGHDWNHDGGTQRMILVTDDGSIVKDTGAGTFTTTLASGLTTTGTVPTFVEAGKEFAAEDRKLFIFTGVNSPQVLTADGATTATMATAVPADWSGANQPSFGINHESRLWCGGNQNDPHRIYFSTANDHEDFTTKPGSGQLSVFPGDSEELVGGVSYKGHLILFKRPKGIFIVDTRSPIISQWRVTKLSHQLGCVGVRGFSQIEDDVVFIDNNSDVRLLKAVTEFGDIGSRSLSDVANMGPFFRDTFNYAQSQKWQVTYYSLKRQVHIAVTGQSATINNTRLVIDFNDFALGKVKFSTSNRDVCEALWVRETLGLPQLTCGANDGFVRLMDNATRSHDSAGYTAVAQTPHMDFSHLDPKLATIRKNGKFLEIVVEPTGNFDISADIIWDDEIQETVSFNTGGNSATLGSFVLGTDKLGGTAILNRKRRITGSGRRLSIIWRNGGDGENFSLAKAYLHFTPGTERL